MNQQVKDYASEVFFNQALYQSLFTQARKLILGRLIVNEFASMHDHVFMLADVLFDPLPNPRVRQLGQDAVQYATEAVNEAIIRYAKARGADATIGPDDIKNMVTNIALTYEIPGVHQREVLLIVSDAEDPIDRQTRMCLNGTYDFEVEREPDLGEQLFLEGEYVDSHTVQYEMMDLICRENRVRDTKTVDETVDLHSAARAHGLHRKSSGKSKMHVQMERAG